MGGSPRAPGLDAAVGGWDWVGRSFEYVEEEEEVVKEEEEEEIEEEEVV